jgi:phage shock protein A|tara:strand:- start:334 stop:657 length:324 start_codon:yes stop_codon:yes gene_type:complete
VVKLTEISTIKSLRDFEKQQEEKLKQTEDSSIQEVENSRKDIIKKINDEKVKLEKIREEEIIIAKEKAKEEANGIVREYKKKIGQLEKKSSKNFEKAVDKIFSTTLS